MKKNKLAKEILDYVKYLLTEDEEYPFESWMANLDHDIDENELAEISYHARYMVDRVLANCKY